MARRMRIWNSSPGGRSSRSKKTSWPCSSSARLMASATGRSCEAYGGQGHPVLRAPRAQGPQEAREVLHREGQRQLPGQDAAEPQDQHRRRHQGSIEQRCEHEALSVEPSRCDIQHAQPADEQPDQAEIVLRLDDHLRQMEQSNRELRHEDDAHALRENQPAEHLDGLRGTALALRAQQTPEHLGQRWRDHVHVRLLAT